LNKLIWVRAKFAVHANTEKDLDPHAVWVIGSLS